MPGLIYRDHYITRAEEAALLAFIDSQPWETELKRRCQHYGGRYQPIRREGEGGLPEIFVPLAQRLAHDGYFDHVPESVGVNDYQPGQGIGVHRDRHPERVEAVAIISLNSALTMDFTRIGHDSQAHYLLPRSLLLISGEARHRWEHGIAPRHNDRIGGLILPRGRRVSLNFRAVKKL